MDTGTEYTDILYTTGSKLATLVDHLQVNTIIHHITWSAILTVQKPS